MTTNTMKIALAFTALILVAAVVFGIMNHQDNSDLRDRNAALELELKGLQAKHAGANDDKVAAALKKQMLEMETKLLEREQRLLAGVDQRINAELAGARSELEKQQEERRRLEAKFESIKENSPVTLTSREREVRDANSIGKVLISSAPEGFVTINAGSSQGIVQGAKFAVRRGTDVIGLLVVSSNEMGPDECPADIVPGSMVPGKEIQAGDEVILQLAWMDTMVQR